MNLEFCITAAIVLGSILMVVNIVRYFLFIKNSHDVLSAGSARDRVWKTIAGVLLVFFLFGYLFSSFIGDPDIVMAMILFGGSIFVASMPECKKMYEPLSEITKRINSFIFD